MTGKRSQTSPVGSPLLPGNISDGSLKDQDRYLPIANVSRIMKKTLPANAKISKEAKETVQECVSEFISFITGEASDKCQREKRKTINGDDLLWAMTTLGFENYVGTLKVYLNKYREIEGDKTSMPSSPTANNHGVTTQEVSKVNNSMSTRQEFQIFNTGFYSLGASQENPKDYEERGMVVGYGDGNIGSRALSTHLHQGIEW
ncbi:hypothetical protein RJ639_006878 [Escallonia herrerae]|uniref:Transcription factor CBF/NF-Y/archaeal histone domain-containing protein n=1 Tax=Escallonia herrerae TaxID=1293975 RepID=A0AA88VZG9_9ASTE|nr:hypothetical protein RJ639_006878 [Escallonia herrerae]